MSQIRAVKPKTQNWQFLRQAVLDVLNYYEHSSKHKTDEKFMTQTSSSDPSPRPSYSVSSQVSQMGVSDFFSSSTELIRLLKGTLRY